MNRIITCILVTTVLIATACSKKSAEMAIDAEKAAPTAIAKDEVAAGAKAVPRQSAGNTQSVRTPTSGKLILTGNIGIQVDALDESMDAVKRIAEDAGGYVANSERGATTGSLRLRVPSDRFDAVLKSLRGTGTVLSLTTDAEDVTLQFYDLEGRIRAKRTVRDRIAAYLARAGSIENLLRVESELGRVTEELESVESTMKNLADRISYSTITVSLSLPAYEHYSGELPSIRNGLLAIGYGFVSFLIVLVLALISVVLFGTPLVLLAALGWYVAFGRLGLIKKLFLRAEGKGMRT
jgi:hypothetical protein